MKLEQAKKKYNTETEIRNYYQWAYRIADDKRENLYIIWQPREGLSYHQKLTYIVMESKADGWEQENGEFIQWRYRYERSE